MAFFGAIAGAIGGALTGLGSFVTGALSTGAKALMTGLGSLGSGLNVVSGITSIIGLLSGLFKTQPDMEDVGLRMYRGAEDGIFREDYNNPEEYFNTLDEKYPELDKSNFTKEELKDFEMAGTAQVMVELKEKLGLETPIQSMDFLGKVGVTEPTISTLKSVDSILDNYNLKTSDFKDFDANKITNSDLYSNIDKTLDDLSPVLNMSKEEISNKFLEG